MKIAVIGYSGSGKSTLAQRLSQYHHIPVLYLDTVHWLPDWKEQTLQIEKQKVQDFLDHNESWVIDGNYSKLSYERRMEEADRIIFMNFNRFHCLWRALRRHYRYKGKSRPSMTAGCDEKMDAQFIKWILWQGRTKKHTERYKAVLIAFPAKCTVLKNQRQLDRFYSSLT